MNLQNWFICFYKKDATTPWVSICYNRKWYYNTLFRLIAWPSATLPHGTGFYQSVVHFLDSVIRNHIDKFFPSTILLINTFMLPADTSLHHFFISFFNHASSKTTKLNTLLIDLLINLPVVIFRYLHCRNNFESLILDRASS